MVPRYFAVFPIQDCLVFLCLEARIDMSDSGIQEQPVSIIYYTVCQSVGQFTQSIRNVMFGATALHFVLENGISKIAVSLIVSCFAYRRISIMSDLLNNLCAFILDSIFGKKRYTLCFPMQCQFSKCMSSTSFVYT